MKNGLLILVIFLFFSCSKEKSYSPDKYLDAKEQKALIQKTIRYSTNLAPQATQSTKFDKQFDWYYDKAVSEYHLDAYLPADSIEYFLFVRKARSITPMKEAIGGKLHINDNGELDYYEEVFRTWKMNEDTLKLRGAKLFDVMVKGGDLSLYYSKYQGDKFIEFPDGRFYFDKQARQWKDSEIDSLYTAK